MVQTKGDPRTTGPGFDPNTDSLQFIGHALSHLDAIFPWVTNLVVTFTAGVANNTWSAWAAIVDTGANPFSAIFAADAGRITAVLLEEANADRVWQLEIGYGLPPAMTVVFRMRFDTDEWGLTDLPTTLPSTEVPAGEIVYARAMCSTGGDTFDAHIRYHLHP